MEAEGAQGLVWSLTIIVMPILLGLAIAFGAYQTWKRRKSGAPVRREPGRIDNVDPNPDDNAQARYMGRLGIISTLVFVVAAVLIVASFFV
ncbi:hypothetical protein [Salinarimonas ramus]|uniref:Uncharacterized protein n=1 Tax=Salinarimonas ramus TaxID=690164 RepID=A0A917V7H4_9HYPH|nr:hypothetical protein [Salinarimonas ramus]GGK46577.1 hypothetical protein GCM10011322_37070 [Salinarimonas ramus]